MTTWWAETISVVTRRLFLAEFFRILANSSFTSLANENEQNRFLTLNAVEISISNGVYREKLHFSRIRNYEITNLGWLLTLVDALVGRNDLRRHPTTVSS